MFEWQRMARVRYERELIINLVNAGVVDRDDLITAASSRLGHFRAKVAVRRLLSCGELTAE